MQEDYYAILKVESFITNAQLKKQYYFLCQAFHPDKFSSTEQKKKAEEEFKKINGAYQVLSDPIKRSAYDLSRAPSTAIPKPPHQTEPNVGRESVRSEATTKIKIRPSKRAFWRLENENGTPHNRKYYSEEEWRVLSAEEPGV